MHHKLENKVLTNADLIITVSSNWAKDFIKLGAKTVEVITNGFDPDDLNYRNKEIEKEFVITHIGSINKDRNPEKFWEVLSDISNTNEDFYESLKIRLIGKVDHEVIECIKQQNLFDRLEKIDYYVGRHGRV